MTAFQFIGFGVCAALLALIVVSEPRVNWTRRRQIWVGLVVTAGIFSLWTYALYTRSDVG